MAEFIEIDLILDNGQTIKALKEVEEQAEDTGRSAGESIESAFEFPGARRALDGIKTGLIAAGAALAALGGLAAVSVRQFAEFENELGAVRTLLDDNSFGATSLEQGFNNLRQEVLQLGATIPLELSAINSALFDTVSAGVAAGNAAQFLATTGRLAVAGLTDVKTATDGVTSVLNAYGKTAQDAEEVAAAFFTAQRLGKTTIDELSTSFGRVGATAAALNVDFNEVLASVSALTTGGIATAEAYTSLSAILRGIIQPTGEASKVAEELGLNLSLAGIQGAGGLAGFLEELQRATGGSQEALLQLFGSAEAVKGILALTGTQAQTFNKILGELANTTEVAATFQEAYRLQSETLSNQLKILQNSIKVIAIEFGTVLAPTVQRLTSFITDLASRIREFARRNGDQIQQFITRFVDGAIQVVGVVIPAFERFFRVVLLVRNALSIAFLAPINAIARLGNAVVSLSMLILDSLLGPLANVVRFFDRDLSRSIANFSENALGGVQDFLEVVQDTTTEGIVENLEAGLENVAGIFGATGTQAIQNFFLAAREQLEVEQEDSPFGLIGDVEGDGGVGTALDKTKEEWQNFGEFVKAKNREISINIRGVLVKSIQSGFAQVGAALANGTDVWAAFAGTILGIIGDLLIQLGSAFIAVGFGVEAIKASVLGLTAGPALAAGLALTLLGGALKAFSSSVNVPASGASQNTANDFVNPGSGATTPGVSQQIDDPDEEDFTRAARIEVNIQGDVLDRRETGLAIIEALEEAQFAGAELPT